LDLLGVLFKEDLTFGEVFLLEDFFDPNLVFFNVLDD